jgi:hypothetical protein
LPKWKKKRIIINNNKRVLVCLTLFSLFCNGFLFIFLCQKDDIIIIIIIIRVIKLSRRCHNGKGTWTYYHSCMLGLKVVAWITFQQSLKYIKVTMIHGLLMVEISLSKKRFHSKVSVPAY